MGSPPATKTGPAKAQGQRWALRRTEEGAGTHTQSKLAGKLLTQRAPTNQPIHPTAHPLTNPPTHECAALGSRSSRIDTNPPVRGSHSPSQWGSRALAPFTSRPRQSRCAPHGGLNAAPPPLCSPQRVPPPPHRVTLPPTPLTPDPALGCVHPRRNAPCPPPTGASPLPPGGSPSTGSRRTPARG